MFAWLTRATISPLVESQFFKTHTHTQNKKMYSIIWCVVTSFGEKKLYKWSIYIQVKKQNKTSSTHCDILSLDSLFCSVCTARQSRASRSLSLLQPWSAFFNCWTAKFCLKDAQTDTFFFSRMPLEDDEKEGAVQSAIRFSHVLDVW